ncbi:phasin family protein [Brevundimonas sp. VNH65]|uniref:phasin family protein n=1 Tax=Brevundimonas sp. VNH65 TaxID=3400917 RepID=UPI003C088C40
MTLLDDFLRDSRAAARNARAASDAAVAGGEMMRAAGEVIAARLDILAAGLADPSKADLTEISLMSSEKIEAASASAAALTRGLGDVGDSVARQVADEMEQAGKAVSRLAFAATPQAFVEAQTAWLTGWIGRAGAFSVGLTGGVLKAQADAWKPIQDAAAANARRLRD